MVTNLLAVLIILLIISIIGYVFTVLKEKLYLKNNMIVIDKKGVTQKHLDKTDIKEFIYEGDKVKSGDEIKIVTNKKEKVKGILIGIIKEDKSLLLVTHSDKIRKCELEEIKKFKIISKYGQFFNI